MTIYNKYHIIHEIIGQGVIPSLFEQIMVITTHQNTINIFIKRRMLSLLFQRKSSHKD